MSGKEPRYVLRALRALPSTSRRLNPNVLHKAIHGFFTSNSAVRDFLLGFLEEVRGRGPGSQGDGGSLRPRGDLRWRCWSWGWAAAGGKGVGQGPEPSPCLPSAAHGHGSRVAVSPADGESSLSPSPARSGDLPAAAARYFPDEQQAVSGGEVPRALSKPEPFAGHCWACPTVPFFPAGFSSAWRQPLGPAALTRGSPTALPVLPLLLGSISSVPFPSCRLRRCLTT